MTMLLRLYTDENAHVGDRRLVDELVRRARNAGLAGATVLRGRIGFGTRAGPIHQHHSLGVGAMWTRVGKHVTPVLFGQGFRDGAERIGGADFPRLVLAALLAGRVRALGKQAPSFVSPVSCLPETDFGIGAERAEPFPAPGYTNPRRAVFQSSI